MTLNALGAFVDIHFRLRHQAVNLARECQLKRNNSTLSREHDTSAERAVNKHTDAAAGWPLKDSYLYSTAARIHQDLVTSLREADREADDLGRVELLGRIKTK